MAAIKPLLDSDPKVQSWSADVSTPDKTLTVTGDIAESELAQRLSQAGGYHLLGEVRSEPAATEQPPSYWPLILIVLYIVGVCLIVEWTAGGFVVMRFMRHFMAGFFLVFSFFKLLDLSAFAASYRMYDLLAKALPAYGWVYPFVELGLGVAYLSHVAPRVVDWVTLVVMLVSTAGVIRSMFGANTIRCACLGPLINLPVSTVTLIEDGGMAVMAAVMLALGNY